MYLVNIVYKTDSIHIAFKYFTKVMIYTRGLMRPLKTVCVAIKIYLNCNKNLPINISCFLHLFIFY